MLLIRKSNSQVVTKHAITQVYHLAGNILSAQGRGKSFGHLGFNMNMLFQCPWEVSKNQRMDKVFFSKFHCRFLGKTALRIYPNNAILTLPTCLWN